MFQTEIKLSNIFFILSGSYNDEWIFETRVMKIMFKISFFFLIYVFAYAATRLIAGVLVYKIKKIDIFFTEIELQQRVFLIKIRI